MKCTTSEILGELFCRQPALEACRGDVVAAFEVMLAAYRSGGKVLTCGNGGSFASRPKDATSSFRQRYLPWQKVFDVGFRVVVEE